MPKNYRVIWWLFMKKCIMILKKIIIEWLFDESFAICFNLAKNQTIQWPSIKNGTIVWLCRKVAKKRFANWLMPSLWTDYLAQMVKSSPIQQALSDDERTADPQLELMPSKVKPRTSATPFWSHRHWCRWCLRWLDSVVWLSLFVLDCPAAKSWWR